MDAIEQKSAEGAVERGPQPDPDAIFHSWGWKKRTSGGGGEPAEPVDASSVDGWSVDPARTAEANHGEKATVAIDTVRFRAPQQQRDERGLGGVGVSRGTRAAEEMTGPTVRAAAEVKGISPEVEVATDMDTDTEMEMSAPPVTTVLVSAVPLRPPPRRDPPPQQRPSVRARAVVEPVVSEDASDDDVAAVDRPTPAWVVASTADAERRYAEVASHLDVPEATAGVAPTMHTSRGRVPIKGPGGADVLGAPVHHEQKAVQAPAPGGRRADAGGGGGGGVKRGGVAGRRGLKEAAVDGEGGGGKAARAGHPPRPPRDGMGLPRAPVPPPPKMTLGDAAPHDIQRRQEALSARRRKSPSAQGTWNEKFLSKYNLKKHNLF